MHVILHIGCEKTGTTSVQGWCDRNRKALAARGILYPLSLGRRNHTALPALAARSKSVDDLRRTDGIFEEGAFRRFAMTLPGALRAEVEASGCSRMLISNEHLGSRMSVPDELETIRSLIEQACGARPSYEIVYYVRRQDDLVQSIYSTGIKSGNTRAFALRPRPKDSRLNPLLVLDLWAGVFGAENLRLRVYDRTLLRGGDIVADLLSLVDPSLSPDAEGFAPMKEANRRLGSKALEFLRLFNAHVPRFTETGTNEARLGVIEALERLPDAGDAALASEAELAAFLDHYAEVNSEVARRYLGREDGVLFPPVARRAAASSAGHGLTTEEAVRIAGFLWNERERKSLRPGARRA